MTEQEVGRQLTLYGSELKHLKSRILKQEKVAKDILKRLKKLEKSNGRNIKKA